MAHTGSLLCFLLLFPLSLALRTLSEAENATTSRHDLGLFDDRSLPKVAQFAAMWQARYALEKHLGEPMATSVRLVLGVFTVAREHAHRDVIRSTWLRQSGVCYWRAQPQSGCSVYVAFILGKAKRESKESKSAEREPGVLLLDVPENMNEGKSMAWMAKAGELFPWATHYGKMDMDTYPFLHKLVARMGANRSCVQASSDYEWIGRPCAFGMLNSGPFREACAYEPCMGWYNTPALEHVLGGPRAPFRFMAGELYILSRALAVGIRWQQRVGMEDERMGDLVGDFSRQHGKCIAVRKLDSHAHLGKPKDWDLRAAGITEAFANDF